MYMCVFSVLHSWRRMREPPSDHAFVAHFNHNFSSFKSLHQEPQFPLFFLPFLRSPFLTRPTHLLISMSSS